MNFLQKLIDESRRREADRFVLPSGREVATSLGAVATGLAIGAYGARQNIKLQQELRGTISEAPRFSDPNDYNPFALETQIDYDSLARSSARAYPSALGLRKRRPF